MEDKSINIDEQQRAPQLGSGAMLSAARKKQNKSIEEIADELNLSLSQIRTIELDQSEGLPEPTYVRGYIRAYANLLGLDAEEVLRHYLNKNWQKSANLDDMPRGIGDGDTSESSVFSPARVIFFLVISGLIAFFWYSGSLDALLGKRTNTSNSVGASSNNTAVESPSNPTDNISSGLDQLNDANGDISEGVQLEGTLVSQEPQSNIQDDLGANENSNAGDGTITATEATGGVDDAAGVEPAVAPVSSETEVVLTFTDTSWVDIRDEQKNKLAYQSYPAGRVLNVSAEGVLTVLIGNAKGVQMTLNGQDYDLSQHTEGVYAKFNVGSAAE